MFFQHLVAQWRVLATVGVLVALPSEALNAKPLPGELAAKERAVQLHPVSPWQLDATDDRCRLGRRFGSGEGAGLVLFEQLAPGKRFDLTVAGPDFASSRKGSWFYAGMRSDLEMETISPLEYGIAGYENAITLGGIWIDDDLSSRDAKSQPIVAAIDGVSAGLVERIVLQRSTTIVSFETGNMKVPFEALNACTRDLLSAWDLDADAHQAYHPPKMPDENAYFSRLHHRLASTPANKGHKSLLRVRAMIDGDGTVSGCHYEYALSSGGLRPDICADIRKMRFDPATSADGEPIASFYSRSFALSEFDPWTADSHGGRWGGGL